MCDAVFDRHAALLSSATQADDDDDVVARLDELLGLEFDRVERVERRLDRGTHTLVPPVDPRIGHLGPVAHLDVGIDQLEIDFTARKTLVREAHPLDVSLDVAGLLDGPSLAVGYLAWVTTLNKIQVGDLTLAYREQGSGPPVLLLHGWPTSSFLWRNVMPPIARANRVLALDLPGFGGSDKPQGATYNFEFFEQAIDGFLEQLDIGTVAIAGHDLGGPVATHWALDRQDRVTKFALLNTLVYPEFSDAVLAFINAASTPGLREQITSPEGLEAAMRLGLANEANLTEEVLAGVREPFESEEARNSLADAGIGLEPEGFVEMGTRLSEMTMPVRLIYGEQDRILPDIAETMARMKNDLPQANVTTLPDCGHFLQEEAAEEIGELLASFFAEG